MKGKGFSQDLRIFTLLTHIKASVKITICSSLQSCRAKFSFYWHYGVSLTLLILLALFTTTKQFFLLIIISFNPVRLKVTAKRRSRNPRITLNIIPAKYLVLINGNFMFCSDIMHVACCFVLNNVKSDAFITVCLWPCIYSL